MTGNLMLNVFRRIANAYRHLDIPLRRYVAVYIGGSVLLASIILVGGLAVAELQFIRQAIVLLALFIVFVAVAYPFILEQRKKREINDNFHIFVTHLTVLSLTNTNRITVFRKLADEEDYGALADEMHRLTTYIDAFNLSLDDACRRRANETSSELLSNFYEELAYNIGSGRNLSDFLYAEQEEVRGMFATKYESQLDKIETVGELFLSTALGMAFLFVFAMLTPFLTGIRPLFILGGVVFLYTFIQVLFTYLLSAVSPNDRIWYFPEDRYSDAQLKIWASLLVGGVGVVLLAILTMMFADSISVYFYLPIPTTALIIPSVVIYQMERDIYLSEQQYPAFVQGLGSIESVKQTSTRDVLRTLKNKDFGRLSEYIRNLYRRLSLSLDKRMAWDLFSAEVSSNLVHRFTDMYVLGRDLGGDPEKIGDIVSENFREIHELRQRRQTMKRKMIGLLYGVTAATSFTYFASLEILDIMVDIGGEVDTGFAGEIFFSHVYDMGVVTAAIFGVVLINSLFTAIIARRIGGTHIAGVVIHIFILVWLNFTIGYGIHYAAVELLDI